jgi:hypothetical protein
MARARHVEQISTYRPSHLATAFSTMALLCVASLPVNLDLEARLENHILLCHKNHYRDAEATGHRT